MKNSVFRDKSVTRVSSPEQLNDYIRVSPPAAFLALTAILLLLVGVIIWGWFGRLEAHTDTGEVKEIAPIEFVIN